MGSRLRWGREKLPTWNRQFFFTRSLFFVAKLALLNWEVEDKAVRSGFLGHRFLSFGIQPQIAVTINAKIHAGN